MINDITCNANNTIELSRAELLGWVNTTLKMNLSKIEQLGAGSAYCQLLDMMYPGKVSLAKVNWKAKSEYEFINNFKILQQSFNKLGVNRNIDIGKLVKCKYQDNLEFLQWFKKIFDSVFVPGRQYDPTLRRKDTSSVGDISRRDAPPPLPRQNTSTLNPSNLNNISVIPSHTTSVGSGSGQHDTSKVQKKNTNTNASFQQVLVELNSCQQPTTTTKAHLATLKEERDFYQSTLAQIEKLIQGFDMGRTSGELADEIEGILLRPPPPVQVSVKGEKKEAREDEEPSLL